MKIRVAVITLWIWLWGILPAAAAMQVSASVDRTDLQPGETLNLMVTIQNGDGRIDTRAITDFKVISRGTSTNMQIINGRTSKEIIHTYLLIPKSKGRLHIPPLTVQRNGTQYHTEPITIRVSEQPAGGPSNRPRDVLVEAAVSEASPYTGQQFTYTFRLYNAVHIANAGLEPPEFKGFSFKEVENRRSFRKIIEGREYAVIEVDYILIPLAPGAITIEPCMLQVDLERPSRKKRSRDPFDRFFNRGQLERRMFQTEPLQVHVRPLPAPAQGQQFSGLVGRFDLKAELDPTSLNVGDSATLAITIQGSGNIMDAVLPELNLPQTLKSYDDHPEEKIELDHHGYQGHKIFRTALVPVQSGSVVLSPVRLTYFDIEENSYRTLTAAIPSLTIGEADSEQTTTVTITPGPQTPGKRVVTFTGRDILPPKENLSAVEHQTPMGIGLFILSLLGPAVLFAAAMLVQHISRPDLSAAAVMKARSRQALKAAQNNGEEVFLTHLYQSLTAAIHAAAGRKGQALTWREAQSILLQKGHPEQEAQAAAQLLAEIESSNFSGARLNANQRDQLLAQVKEMTRKLAP